ncbi:TaqI-like C-terminal specificity domain-containing protein [Novosphingobium sp. PASSN1]|uniref:Eco57I restriction-modification methylase domain-containing protein n=1 Tax=Novosphingobium sp. PASSN1 TaxID=2015561 RepID=UPI000BC7F364|nr:TaqI-like C-terminal specificity domain-containing protein [Novosphingobium sp. PASSN1]OYU34063.1 MAG: hypothetical protein CFE35_17395 [Novosphingobium sp. PASSN1]
MSHATDTLPQLRDAAIALASGNLETTVSRLLGSIGYASPKTLAIDTSPARFIAELNIDPAKLAESLPRIRAVHFLFQLTGDELPALSRNTAPQTGATFQRGAIDSFVFLAVDLDDGTWSRRELVTIVREFNRGFAMPAIILFRHAGKATLAVIDRRANRRDPSRDVVGGRISLVKDIDLAKPHRAHVEILADLSLAAIARKKAPADFRDLYDRWIETLSAAELNKRFYAELADWFAWASTKKELVTFPKGQPADDGGKEVGLIRLLTRLMFVWFIKEKGLVPLDLFSADTLGKLLKAPPQSTPAGHDFYLAVLQNLFFATLNTEMDQRRWRKEEDGQSKDYLGHHVFRHEAKFADKDAAEALFNQVPFLNGGLFECLDTEITSPEDERKARAEKERQRLILRVDGFSDQPDKQPKLQNRIFYGGEDAVDLSRYYEKAVRPRNVSGLIDLFERYKFTIEENTPLEEEAALDPELLGKVFENLLASYNEDTKTTARNKSGSFYTPREVVEFMVDEALLAYLMPKIAPAPEQGGIRPAEPGLDFGAAPGELGLEATGNKPQPNTSPKGEALVEPRLRALLDFASRTHDFTPAQVDALIAAIESCKAIDPAVGSGAFPLGLLQKLVHALAVLDPGGDKWKARNRAYYENNLSRAEAVLAPNEREAAMATAQAELDKFDAAFGSGHYPDYTRKLYLIERCLHGVDIQPIAVQIAKLRCFISLAVEQKADDARPNRGITPLPNLETKLVAANTLTPLHRKGQMELQDKQIDVTLGKLRGEFASLFTAANGAAKRKIQKGIDDLIEQLVQLLKDDRALSSDEVKLVAQWRPFDQNNFAPFFDPVLMFGFKRSANDTYFDIALANPPYVRAGKIDPKLKLALKSNYPKFFSGSSDLLTYFFKVVKDLLVSGGVMSFITSNNYMRAGYGGPSRELLSKHLQPVVIVDFGEMPVFKAAVDSTVYIGVNAEGRDEPFRALTIKSVDDIAKVGQMVRDVEPSIKPSELDANGWSFASTEYRKIADSMESMPTKLKHVVGDRFYLGIKTGFVKAFLINDVEREKLIDGHDSAAGLIRPWIDGGEIERWGHRYSGKHVIAIASGANVRGGWPWSGKKESAAEAIFKEAYPTLHQHLSKWREELKARGDKGEYWWELRSCAYWSEFDKEKIAYNETSTELHAFVDTEKYCLNNTAFIFIPEEPWAILAVLMSKPMDFYYRMRFSSYGDPFNGGRPRFLRDRMLTVPVPDMSPDEKATLALMGIVITRSREAGKLAVCNRLESLLNAFVYELFFPEELAARGLSPFAAAREAGLDKLAGLEGEALAAAADAWSAQLADPATRLYATLFDLQSIDAIRIIEGRG